MTPVAVPAPLPETVAPTPRPTHAMFSGTLLLECPRCYMVERLSIRAIANWGYCHRGCRLQFRFGLLVTEMPAMGIAVDGHKRPVYLANARTAPPGAVDNWAQLDGLCSLLCTCGATVCNLLQLYDQHLVCPACQRVWYVNLIVWHNARMATKQAPDDWILPKTAIHHHENIHHATSSADATLERIANALDRLVALASPSSDVPAPASPEMPTSPGWLLRVQQRLGLRDSPTMAEVSSVDDMLSAQQEWEEAHPYEPVDDRLREDTHDD